MLFASERVRDVFGRALIDTPDIPQLTGWELAVQPSGKSETIMAIDDIQTGRESETRRDFLFIATGAVAAVGLAASIWPLLSQMSPDAATIAAGAPLDVDIGALAAGQQIMVSWRGHPIVIVSRPPAALKTLQDPALVALLSDPGSQVRQQPPYAENWHRSLKPEVAVLVGYLHPSRMHPDSIRAQQEQLAPRNWLGG